jgi:hypothetical protein
MLTPMADVATPQPHGCFLFLLTGLLSSSPELLQGYNSDRDLEILGPFLISFRFSSFFRRFSSSLRAFWKGSVLEVS